MVNCGTLQGSLGLIHRGDATKRNEYPWYVLIYFTVPKGKITGVKKS